MGGADKKTNQLLESQRREQAAEHQASMQQQNQRSNEAYGRQNQMFDSMFGGFDNFIKGGGVSEEDKARLRGIAGGSGGSGGGGGGGYYGGSPIDIEGMGLREMEGWMRDSIGGKTTDTNRLRAGNATIEGLMRSGGYTPEQLEELGNVTGMFNAIGQTGGIDPQAMERMRGMGVFDEYSRTGGIDARTEQQMRDRATSVIPSMYDSINRTAGRNAAITGSVAGNAALMSKNAREQAQAMSAAARDAELGIFDRRDEGRRWGASSAATAESGLQNQISSNRQNALQASAGITGNIANNQAQMQFGAAKQLNEGEIPIQQMLQDERRYGIQGMEQIIQKRIAEQERQQAMAAAAAAASANDARMSQRDQLELERYLMEYGNENRQFGLEGMLGLYGQEPAESRMYIDSELARRGLNTQGQNANIGMQYENRSKLGENLMGLAGAGLGVAGGFMTAGTPRKPTSSAGAGRAGTGVRA